MPSGGDHEAFLATDYNAEMIEHVERRPEVRDRALFVGSPEDIAPLSFGRDLPAMRDWVPRHFEFPGYIIGEHPAALDRERNCVEARLPPGRACLHRHGRRIGRRCSLIRRILQSYPLARTRMPELRMVFWPVRASIRVLSMPAGVDVRTFVPDLDRHLAACDLALVQGGLTTCMELTAAGTPFIYFPLRNHFEQNFHVVHRLDRYGAGRRMEFATSSPEMIADAMVTR